MERGEEDPGPPGSEALGPAAVEPAPSAAIPDAADGRRLHHIGTGRARAG